MRKLIARLEEADLADEKKIADQIGKELDGIPMYFSGIKRGAKLQLVKYGATPSRVNPSGSWIWTFDHALRDHFRKNETHRSWDDWYELTGKWLEGEVEEWIDKKYGAGIFRVTANTSGRVDISLRPKGKKQYGLYGLSV